MRSEVTGTAEDALALKGLQTLIVEDNATNRAILQRQATSWGMRSEVTGTAEDALALMQSAAQHGRQYDLALLDMKLPGIDGLELARRIKADPSTASVTLVMLTSMDGRAQERTMSRLRSPRRSSNPFRS